MQVREQRVAYVFLFRFLGVHSWTVRVLVILEEIIKIHIIYKT